jgi:RNA polymerase sigma factor (sigma-70 family)
MTDRDAASLVSAARLGSSAAFASLVRLHESAVLGFVSRLSSRNSIDAEDIAQEAFVTAWQQLANLGDPVLFRAWVCRIAYRKYIDRYRAERRRRNREIISVEGIFEDALRDSTPNKRLDLERALAQLSDDQRAVVSLCMVEGFSHVEASEALGMPLGTIKSHLNRARDRLLGLLEGET